MFKIKFHVIFQLIFFPKNFLLISISEIFLKKNKKLLKKREILKIKD